MKSLFLGWRVELVRNKSRFYVLFQTNGAGLGAMFILMAFLTVGLRATTKQPIQRHSMVVSECV